MDLQDQHSNENSAEEGGGYSDQGYDEPHPEDNGVGSDSMEDVKFPDDESEEGYKDSHIQNLPHTSNVDKNTSIPSGVLSHYIPGDTPTLYAGTFQTKLLSSWKRLTLLWFSMILGKTLHRELQKNEKLLTN